MTKANKGWLDNYILFFKKFSQTEDFNRLIEKINIIENPELFIYTSVQPTGIMYGLPFRFTDIDLPENQDFNEHDKTKMILIDCLINYSLYLKSKDIPNEETTEKMLNQIINNIGEFYHQLNSNGKSNADSEQIPTALEHLIDRRLAVNKNWNKNFWSSYFQDSLLFLDIIYFSHWLRHGDIARSNKEKEDVYFLILKIIAASANANSHIEKEEEMLFQNFLHSTQLREEKIKMANEYFFKGISLDFIDFSEVDSWVIKKYLLEIAIFTIWSDRVLEASEKRFLTTLTEKLGFTELELEESLIAIEGFVLSNWDKIPYKNSQANFQAINNDLTTRIGLVVENRLELSKKKLPVTEQISEIIKKSNVETLSKAEDKILKSYLRELIEEIPSLAVFLLPGGSIMLPQILKSLSI